MNLTKIENFFDTRKDLGILLLRLFIGGRLFYGVIDNVLSWEHMLAFEGFLQANGFPFPLVSAVVSVYAQFICSIMILLGFRIRIAAIVMVINFIVALLFVHIATGDTVEGMTPALAMLFGSLTLLFTGAGKYSLDQKSHSN